MKIVRGKAIDLSSEGKGVVKNGKDIIFVDGLFPNEEADIQILYQRAGVYFGKVKKLYKLSEDRIQPRCKICTSCGGCQYQQLDYQAQLKYKTKRVKEALVRIAKVNADVQPCIGMDNPYNYRNKIQVPFAKDRRGVVRFGFYKENTHIIVPIKQCVIEDKRAAPILWDIKLLLEKMNIPVYNEDSGKGILRYVLIRTSYHYDELMVVLVTTSLNFPGQRNFINSLVKKHPEITTVVGNVNSRKTNVVLGSREKVLYGPGHIKEDILGLTFEISASSFFQINPIQVEKLYNAVLNLIDVSKNETVLDAYSGVGTIGLIVAKNARKVISVEVNKSAHKNAVENAKRNKIENIEFICDDAGEYIAKCDEQIDVVIMDPPRSGSDEKFLSALIRKRIGKIVYVSCDPETLARDIKYLSDYYDVKYVQPIDMFPMTAHVETVVGLCLCND
ncbi:MAG TPA: 23S rRNA (uracil(1939)-C(5))-methyltransferase RlmD [Erysipelotrichaceae bacterium]|nr:23S rRNA (uracil(1939)-C(5))-methyltransferase RlmD [Erysipelotrichaceae bacterium]